MRRPESGARGMTPHCLRMPTGCNGAVGWHPSRPLSAQSCAAYGRCPTGGVCRIRSVPDGQGAPHTVGARRRWCRRRWCAMTGDGRSGAPSGLRTSMWPGWPGCGWTTPRRLRRRRLGAGTGTSSCAAGSPTHRRPGSRRPTPWCWPRRTRTAGRRRARCSARASTSAASCSTPTTRRRRATTCASCGTRRPPSPGTPSTGRCTCAVRSRRWRRRRPQEYWASRPRGLAAGGLGVAAVDGGARPPRARRRAGRDHPAVRRRRAGAGAGALGRLADRARAGGVLAGPGRPDARPAALRARPGRPQPGRCAGIAP